GIPQNADDLKDSPGPTWSQRTCYRETDLLKMLLKGIFRPKLMRSLLLEEPYMMIMAIVSPGIMMAMYNSGAFEMAVRIWINQKQSIVKIAVMLSALAHKVSIAESLLVQRQILDSAAGDLLEATVDGVNMHFSYLTAITLLTIVKERHDSDYSLLSNGFVNHDHSVARIMEKSYLAELEAAWRDLTWLEKLRATWYSRKLRRSTVKPLHATGNADMKGLLDISPSALLGRSFAAVRGERCIMGQLRTYININCRFSSICRRFKDYPLWSLCNTLFIVCIFLNTLFIICIFLSITSICPSMILEHRKYKLAVQLMQEEKNEIVCMELYVSLQRKLGREFTWDEYIEYLKTVNPAIVHFAEEQIEKTVVSHQ
nr:P3 protein [Pepper severe mosaic virus]